MGHSKQELRDRRLLGEYQELMAFSDRSPLVKIERVGSHWPPTEYEVIYDCYGYTDGSRRHMATGHKVHITLPAGYPQTPPIFQYESPVWAPAFMSSYQAGEHGGRTIKNYICIGHIGTPQIPLYTFVIGVGHMIQLRRDAGGLKPVDTRSLEGPDVLELITTLEPSQEAAPTITVLDAAAPTGPGEDEIVIKVIDEKPDDDLNHQIKFPAS